LRRQEKLTSSGMRLLRACFYTM